MERRILSAHEAAVFAIVCLILMPFVSNYGVDGDMMSRNVGELAMSLVNERDASLDEFVDGMGEGRKDLGDKASYRGHVYSGMPPGLSWVMAPVYMTVKPLVRLAGRFWGGKAVDRGGAGALARDFVALMFVSSVAFVIVTALAAALTFRFVQAICGSAETGLLAALAWPVCSWFLPCATHVSTKSAAAILIFCAFCIAFAIAHSPVSGCRRRAGFAVAGALGGLSVAVDYIPGAYVAILFGYILWRAGWRESLWFGLAALPVVSAVAVYHGMVFGDWYSTSYSYRLVPYGTPPRFDYPDWRRVYGVIASPYKGILWYAPWIVPAAWGCWRAGRGKYGPECASVLGVVLVTMGVNLCVNVWEGFGWGPRLSMASLPFLALGTAFLSRRALRVMSVLLVIALLWNATVLLTGGVYVDEKRWDIPPLNHLAAMSEHGMANYTLRFLSRHVWTMSPWTMTVIQTALTGLTAFAAWRVWRWAERKTAIQSETRVAT